MHASCWKFPPSEISLDICEEHRQGLYQQSDATDRLRISFQDKDHSGNDPHLGPGFVSICSGMLPEQFRSVFVLWVQEKFA